jgi:hypothetical protein
MAKLVENTSINSTVSDGVMQGLKSIGNTGTAFPGRHTVGRKEEAFFMRNQEEMWSFMP